MRIATRILIGVAAASVVAVGAPTAASAATSYDSWGPYYSSDHKTKAQGHVKVDRKRVKHWTWKTVYSPKRVCKWRHGERKCWVVKKKDRKRVLTWRHVHQVDVRSRLSNHRAWGKNKCAWETFKIVTTGGHTSFKRFKNCDKHTRTFSFSGSHIAHVYVNVSRGNEWSPKGWNSGWQDVYHAV